MDVIINTPTPQAQAGAMIQIPAGYGPGPGYGGHHGGPGFLLPLLLIGGFLFLRTRDPHRSRGRRRDMHRLSTAGGPTPPHDDDWQLREDPREDVRDLFRQGRDKFFSDGALTIVRERYARGEIDAAEYATLCRTLNGENEHREPEPDRPDAGEGGLKL